VSQVEIEPAVESQHFVNDLLAWIPPLPVGKLPTEQFFPEPGTKDGTDAPGFAWGRLPRFMSETKHSFSGITEPIITLDVCSSVPLYAQMLRTREFTRSGTRATELTNNLYGAQAIMELKDIDLELRSLAAAVASRPRNVEQQFGLREHMISAIQASLYTQHEGKTKEEFEDELSRTLREQTKIYQKQAFDPDDPDACGLETRWQMRYNEVETQQTYIEILAQTQLHTPEAVRAAQLMSTSSKAAHNLFLRTVARQTRPAGKELADRLADWQVAKIAQEVVGNPRYRVARFLSMDLDKPAHIAASSLLKTPQATQRMNMFSHAVNSLFEPKMHLQGNALEPLPVPDRSLALITCFDGWPFHFPLDQYADSQLSELADLAVATLKNWYDKLVYGGKAIIFPWTVEGDDPKVERLLLNVTAELGRITGIGVNLKLFHRETLEGWMSEGDRQLADVQSSRIFANNKEFFQALMIEKPHKGMAERVVKLAGKTAIGPDRG
jgi:hypothetical protein